MFFNWMRVVVLKPSYQCECARALGRPRRYDATPIKKPDRNHCGQPFVSDCLAHTVNKFCLLAYSVFCCLIQCVQVKVFEFVIGAYRNTNEFTPKSVFRYIKCE